MVDSLPGVATGDRNAATRYGAEEISKIFRLAEEGHSNREISKLMVTHESYVSAILHGRVRKDLVGDRAKAIPDRRSKVSDQQVQELRRLYRTGTYTQTELAKMFRVSPSYVSMVARGLCRL